MCPKRIGGHARVRAYFYLSELRPFLNCLD
uniref:Uncharacterized protein n=1 Tax=Arundo donax TaxID=35708 RepID=A0A0A8YZR8_ARUDO